MIGSVYLFTGSLLSLFSFVQILLYFLILFPHSTRILNRDYIWTQSSLNTNLQINLRLQTITDDVRSKPLTDGFEPNESFRNMTAI